TLSLILLRIENTGNQPILEGDFNQPIRLSISPTAAIGEVSVQETRPTGILLTPSLISSSEVRLSPTLLNPGDQAIIRILAVNNHGTLSIDARIAGLPQLEVHSVLQESAPASQAISNRIGQAVIVFVVILAIGLKVWDSRPFMRWRREHRGFDPAQHFYIAAQDTMVKNTDRRERWPSVVASLKQACERDPSYIHKAQSNPLFIPLKGYERYEAFVRHHSQREGTEGLLES
ncbi:MAG: hypothetical protein ACRDG5_00590, partial [Anaerolineales bacterium]